MIVVVYCSKKNLEELVESESCPKLKYEIVLCQPSMTHKLQANIKDHYWYIYKWVLSIITVNLSINIQKNNQLMYIS